MTKTPEEILEHRRQLDRERQKRMYYKKKLLKAGAKVEEKPEKNKDVICIKVPPSKKMPIPLGEYLKSKGIKIPQLEEPDDNEKITLEDAINKIHQFNKPADNRPKSRTAGKYVEDIKRLYYITNFNDLRELLKKDPDDIIKQIKKAKQKINQNEVYSTNTLLGIVQVINNLIKYFKIKLPEATINRYNHEWEVLQATDKVNRDRKRTDESESVLKFSHFINLLENKKMQDTKLYTMARLYQEVPVRDDLNLNIIDVEDEIKKNINYLILRNDDPYKVLIQYSKGVKEQGSVHEPVLIKLSADTAHYIKKYMTKNKLTRYDVLFYTFSGKNTEYISRAMSKIGLKGGFTEWRRMIIADLDKYNIDDRVKLSKVMGHSLQMQQGYERVIK